MVCSHAMRTSTLRALLFWTIVGMAPLAAGCICSSSCPTLSPASRAQWERDLEQRYVLKLDPKADIAIKRDVHNVIIDVEASDLAAAFQQVMMDPNRRFGLIRIDRLKRNVGKPFSVGERFQGRYVIADAVKKDLKGIWKKLFGELAEDDGIRQILCGIENEMTSDYGVITQLRMDPAPGEDRRMQYKYLSGSPIAGSSTFIITPIDDPKELERLGVPVASRITQVFEYQELTATFAQFFGAGGLKMHNQVVYNQALAAAEQAGGKVLESDIPKAYLDL